MPKAIAENDQLDYIKPDFLESVSDRVITKAREIYDAISADEVIGENLELRGRHPSWNTKRMAASIVSHYIKVCSGIGVTAASSSVVPVVGGAISYASVLPEELFLMKYLFTMTMRIGDIYGYPPESLKFNEILSVLYLDGNQQETKPVEKTEMVAERGLKKVSAKTATRLGDRIFARAVVSRFTADTAEQAIARNAVIKGIFRGILKRFPFFGIIMGGGLNHYFAKNTGKRAIQYFERKSAA